MMLTEDEAKTKWCPFARELAQVQDASNAPISITSVNRHGAIMSLCIASACMAWRWRVSPQESAAVAASGYCGLAGEAKK